jgi:Predicted transcriptional regulators
MDKEAYMKALGLRIREVRDEMKLTQEQVAENAGMTPTYLSRIETGAAMPSVFIVDRIAVAMDVHPCFILPLSKPSSGHSNIDMLLESAAPETRKLAEKLVQTLVNVTKE